MFPKIYFNGLLADLNGDEKIVLSSGSSDFAVGIEKRQGVYSNTFSLPDTVNNRKIIDSANILISGGTKQYEYLDCMIEVGGAEFIGLGSIESITDTFNILVVCGNSDFFKSIEGKDLSDIDLSEFDHTWDIATIIASFANTNGYIYQLNDNTSDGVNAPASTGNNTTASQYFCSVFLHTMVTKIVDDAFYSKSGKIFTGNTFYPKVVLPFCKSKLEYDEEYINSKLFKVRKVDELILNFPTAHTSIIGENPIQFNDDTSSGYFDNANTFNVITGKWIVPTPGKYIFTIENIVSIFTTGPWEYHFSIVKENPDFLLDNFSISGSGNSLSLSNIFTSVEVLLQKGESIRVEIGVVTSSAAIIQLHPNNIFKNSLNKDIQFNGDIFMSGIVPNMKQSDIIKLFMQLFCIIPITDVSAKTIEFIQFKEVIQNKNIAPDWSEKVDPSETPEITFKSSYAQKNLLKYAEDDSVKFALGDDFFTIQNEVLEKESEAVELIVAFSESVFLLDNMEMAKIPLCVNGVPNKTIKQRILFLNYVNRTVVLNATSFTGNVPVGCAGHVTIEKNMSWRSLKDESYTDLINVLNEYKEVKGLFKLNATEINKIRFDVPVWVKQNGENYGSYFYLCFFDQFEITSYQSTNVKLLKI